MRVSVATYIACAQETQPLTFATQLCWSIGIRALLARIHCTNAATLGVSLFQSRPETGIYQRRLLVTRFFVFVLDVAINGEIRYLLTYIWIFTPLHTYKCLEFFCIGDQV